MNWDAIGAVGETVGALAVVLSFLFVGNQLRLGQKIERAGGQRDVLNQAREWITKPQSNPDLFAAVSTVMMGGYEKAHPDQQQYFFTWMWDFLLLFEQAYYMHEDGFFTDSSFYGFESLAMAIVRTPGGGECWENYTRHIWAKEPAAYFEKRLQETHGEEVSFDYFYPYFASKFRSLEEA